MAGSPRPTRAPGSSRCRRRCPVGECRLRRRCGRCRSRTGRRAGRARVGAPRRRMAQQHVGRLDVTVHHAGPVGVGQRVGHLRAQWHRPPGPTARGGQQRAEVATADELGGDVGRALVVAVGVDGDDVGRVEAGQHGGLALEAALELVAAAQSGRDHLESHRAAQGGVGGADRRRPCRRARPPRRAGSGRSVADSGGVVRRGAVLPPRSALNPSCGASFPTGRGRPRCAQWCGTPRPDDLGPSR